MKTLYLLRHGQYGSGDPLDAIAEPDPGLNETGRTQAAHMGRHIDASPVKPDLVLSSNARRAKETCNLVVAALSGGCDVSVEDDVRRASDQSLLERLNHLGAAHDTVLVIGHNPTLHRLALWLAAGGDGACLQDLRSDFPPCALAVLSFDADNWAAVTPGSGRLTGYATPATAATAATAAKAAKA